MSVKEIFGKQQPNSHFAKIFKNPIFKRERKQYYIGKVAEEANDILDTEGNTRISILNK